jgi:hypothetical protein
VLRAGMQVVGIVDVASSATRSRNLLPDGVPLYLGWTIQAAHGGAEVERVTLVNLASGAHTDLEVDTVCVAIGRQPAVELAYVLGCKLAFDPALGGVHAIEATGRQGVFVAGDLTGAPDDDFIDPSVAEESGRRAARAAAAAMGHGVAAEPLSTAGRNGHSGSYLTEWHRHADRIATDDLVVCRCEEIDRRTLLAAADLVGIDHPDEVKRVSRAGMGVCQGRGCRPIVAGILAARTGRPLADMPLDSYRPPVRPIPLAALATEEDRPVPRPPALVDAETRLTADVHAGTLHPMAALRFWRAAEETLYRLDSEAADPSAVEAAAREIERKIRYSHRTAPA